MHTGDIVREKYGSWLLWRVLDVYEEDSPYFHAELISQHKCHAQGKKALLKKAWYFVEKDPLEFSRRHGSFDVYL